MILKNFNADSKGSLNKLQKILDLRKNQQKNSSDKVKKILLKVQKYGDKAVLKYEQQFSKLKVNSKKLTAVIIESY